MARHQAHLPRRPETQLAPPARLRPLLRHHHRRRLVLGPRHPLPRQHLHHPRERHRLPARNLLLLRRHLRQRHHLHPRPLSRTTKADATRSSSTSPTPPPTGRCTPTKKTSPSTEENTPKAPRRSAQPATKRPSPKASSTPDGKCPTPPGDWDKEPQQRLGHRQHGSLRRHGR